VEWADSHNDNSLDSRWIIDTFPKILFLFTVLFFFPRTFWDSYVGGSLKSYLQYMQYIIERIKTKMEEKENGYYGSKKQPHMRTFDQHSKTWI